MTSRQDDRVIDAADDAQVFANEALALASEIRASREAAS